MEAKKPTITLHERDGDAGLTPLALLRHSGKAVSVGAVTGAVAGAMAGAVAGAAAWAMWVLGREAVKALRDRTGI
jgi:hypothetical protein